MEASSRMYKGSFDIHSIARRTVSAASAAFRGVHEVYPSAC